MATSFLMFVWSGRMQYTPYEFYLYLQELGSWSILESIPSWFKYPSYFYCLICYFPELSKNT